MNSDKGSTNWISLQQKIHEMRAETEVWVAKNEVLKAEREARQAQTGPQYLAVLKHLINWFSQLVAQFGRRT